MKSAYMLVAMLTTQFACGSGAAAPETSSSQRWLTVSAGVYHSCGATVEGVAYCWGLNDPSGSLGIRDSLARVRPARVVTDRKFSTVSVGGAISCGLAPDGRAYCWGDGLFGVLGNGSEKGSGTPVAVVGDHIFSQISVGFEHVCALTPTGDAYCWGNNMFGELGDGTKTKRASPTRVGFDGVFKAISAGNMHSCAIASDGMAYCWGGSTGGEGGNPCAALPCGWLTPRAVATDVKFVAIAAANTYTCGLSTSAEAWCWGGATLSGTFGLDERGILGNGALKASAVPVKVLGNHRLTELAAGTRSVCAVAEGGDLFCWGSNSQGELGIGRVDDDPHPIPTRVAGGIKFSHVSVGDTACAIDQEGVGYCWATTVGQPDASGGIRIQGLTTRPTVLPDPET